MSRYRSARAVLAGAAVVALAGCGSATGTSSAASSNSPAGAVSSPAGTTSPTATPTVSTGSVVAPGSIPFPVAVGNTWVYQVVAAINNAHGLDTKKILDVTAVPGGNRVTMSDSIGPGTPITTQEHYIFFADGQLGFPVKETRGVSVLSGNGVIWPDAAGVASGRPYHLVLNIKLGSGALQTSDVTVQGGGTQSVSVPAGTFQATLVTMSIVTKVGNFTSISVLKVWTAPGTGPVKTEELQTAGGKTTLNSTSTLLSFTKQAAGS